jgi:LEA14-like dessication related protein
MTTTARRSAAILTAAACIVSAAAGGGCEMKTPSVRLRDIRVAEADFEKLQLLLDFEIANPNSYQISLWGFEVALTAAGEEFAAGSLDRPVMGLSAGEAANLRAPVTIRYADVPELVSRPDRPAPCDLSAKATFSFLVVRRAVSFTHAGQVPPLRAPSWRFRDLRSRGQGVVELVFDVTNPNTFELPLGRLAGVLKCGDETLVRVNRLPPGPVPAGRTARLVVPVSMDPQAALRAAARAEAAPRSLRFEGTLQLGPPPPLRAMLLGLRPAPAPDD